MEILDWSNEYYAWQTFVAPNENGDVSWLFQQPKICDYFVTEEVKLKGESWYELPTFSSMNLEPVIEDYNNKIDMFFKDLGHSSIYYWHRITEM